MPTVLRIGAHRFFFFAGDKSEPSHVHVERDNNLSKFWLDPVCLQSSGDFSRLKLRDTGCIDFVLAPERIATEIARIARSIK